MTKTKLAVVALALCSACGPNYNTASICLSDGLMVGSEYVLDATNVIHNIGLAKRLLDEYGIVRSDDFEGMFKTTSVHIVNSSTFTYIGEVVTGSYSPDGDIGIVLGSSGSAMLHELLRHVDFSRHGVSAVTHFQLTERGWSDADREFAANCLDPKLHK